MALIQRTVQNPGTTAITLRVPGTNPRDPVVIGGGATVDLLTVISEDELESLASELQGLVDRGSLNSIATIDTDALHRAAEVDILTFGSNPSSGGGSSEAMTFTGLKTTDKILAFTQRVAGSNGTAMTGWNTFVTDGMTITWTGDPGAGAIILVVVKR